MSGKIKVNTQAQVKSGPYAGMCGRVSSVSRDEVVINVQSAGQRFGGMQRTVEVTQKLEEFEQ